MQLKRFDPDRPTSPHHSAMAVSINTACKNFGLREFEQRRCNQCPQRAVSRPYGRYARRQLWPPSRRPCIPQRRSTSLIGCLGQAHFPYVLRTEIVYPGHASLRSLVWRSKGAAACMCRIGSGEPRFPARFKLRSRHFRLHPRTSSGLDDPVRLSVRLLVHAVPPT